MGINSKIGQIGKPHFLCIGAPKTATTWLNYCLSQHSQIWIPPFKELNFFTRYENSFNQFLRTCYLDLTRFAKETIKGNRTMKPYYLFYYIWRDLPLLNYPLFMLFHIITYPYVLYRGVKTKSDNLNWYTKFLLGRLKKINPEKWYVSLFEPTRKQICGEFTTGYCRLSDSSIDYMLSFNRNMRIIYLIRNPIERDWSATNMLTASKPHSSQLFLDIGINPRGIFPSSDYLGTLKRYLKYVAPENFFLGFYEDILFNQNRFMAALQEFLGVSEENIIHKPRHTGRYKGIKLEYAVNLAQRNLLNIQEMASIFGDYTNFWYDVASELCQTDTTNHPDETFISTPFATNDLWRSRWECSGAKDFQSGPLSSLPFVKKLIP